MNKISDRPIRKFNPGTLQSDKEVIDQFVVRKHELDLVLETLRGNIVSPSCQHFLLVAPRGRGKTMLLARIAAELRTNDELSERLFPVRFMEESHEVFNLADFWLEALFHLARELARESAASDPELAQELREAHKALATDQWHGEKIADRARAAVLDASDRMEKKLVLMVENLQTLCNDVDDDFGWKLRETLQTEPQIILLATATSRFKGLDDATQPFFELFQTVYLELLTTEACQRLWQVVSGDEISEREIRPLQILTGGNPRLLIIVAEFAQHRSLRQLMEELVKLVDDHTEYFRGHLEVLSKTERRVYLAVIDLWQLSSSNEIAARARMDIRAVSTMLGRLVERGAVLMEGSGRKRMYTAAERLYSIYYKLRRERDEAAVVHNLLRFMTAFYSIGNAKEALDTCNELERRFDILADNSKDTLWPARWIRTKAFIAQNKHQDALSAFRSLYAVFVPDNTTVSGMMICVSNLIANGVAERDLVEILSSDKEKSDVLGPLIIALRQRAGETVRAPAETLEVASDVRQHLDKFIEEKAGHSD